MLVVGGQHGNTVVSLHFLQQQGGFVVVGGLIGAAVVTSLGKQGIALVEEQNDVALLGLPEDHGDGLFCFAYILVHNLGQVHTVQLQIHLVGNDLGAHGFTGTGSAEQQHGQSAAVGVLLDVVPLLVNLLAVDELVAGVFQRQTLVGIHDDVIPTEVGSHAGSLLGQLVAHLIVAGLEQNGAGNVQISVHIGKRLALAQGILDLAGSEEKLGGQLRQIHIGVEDIGFGIVLPDLFTLGEVGGGQFQLGEIQIGHLLEGHFLLAGGKDGEALPGELAEGQIHIAEEFVLFLVPVAEIVQADTGVRQDAFPCGGP